jgi:hypothetical protein
MGARFVLNIPQAQESFWTHPMEVLGDVGMSNLVLDCLETVLLSVQDRCMVWAKHTIGLEIIWDAPYGTLVTRVKWMLISFRSETVLVGAR